MDIYKTFATDAELELEGVWHDVGDGARLKIARADNTNFKRKMKVLAHGRERIISLGMLSEEESETLLGESMACTILMDWAGIEDGGKSITFSVDAAAELLIEHAGFRDLVETLSMDFEHYRPADLRNG